MTFMAPDPRKLVDRLPLASPGLLADLYDLSFDDILDYLEELGRRLDINTNEHMQRARELTYDATPSPRALVDFGYSGFNYVLRTRQDPADRREKRRTRLPGGLGRAPADRRRRSSKSGRSAPGVCTSLPATAPVLGLITLPRSAISRSDCIIKAPSNDPFTSSALAMTMCDMAPDHPITKHFAVAYWQGGDAEVEDKLYQPHNIEKIIAWGGLAGIKHVTKYMQPGLELIALDPKTSISIVGPEALDDEQQMQEAAHRLADRYRRRQPAGCASSRVTYVLTGSHHDGVERVIEFGKARLSSHHGPSTHRSAPCRSRTTRS